MTPTIDFEPGIDFEEVRGDVLARTGALFEVDNLEPRLKTRRPQRFAYLPVRAKFAIACIVATAWMVFSIYLSLNWLHELSRTIGGPAALYLIAFIAYVPGFMNAFLMVSLLLDHRPARAKAERLPGVTVLVPCYNESAAVADTIGSLAMQRYPGNVEYLVIDDGSKDNTLQIARDAVAALPPEKAKLFRVIAMEKNGGKSAAMNRGLTLAHYKLVASVDGDCWLLPTGLARIVTRYLADPPDTRAVAGTILVRNSRKNWITKVQEWDYFHGIAAIKRMQSMYHGTLVAQGAFSLYDRQLLEELGGWPHCVGEDIVLSWAILDRGYRIGHCEDALMFTNVPENFRQFAHQRKRWSRGLIEAFMRHGGLLFKLRMSTLFVWWNLLFLPMDLAYCFGFMPGMILALFGYYYIVGIMTLVLLPMAMACNGVMLYIEGGMFRRQGLKVRQNLLGFFFYAICYSFILQPVSIWGYMAELLGLKKSWGTK